MAATRNASRDSRSISASESPPSRPRLMSSALALTISSVRASSASAIASRAVSLGARGSGASLAAAARARLATSRTSSAVVMPRGYDGDEAGGRGREVLLPPGEDALRPDDVDTLRLRLRRPVGVLRLVAVAELDQPAAVEALDPALDDDHLVATLQVDDDIGAVREVAALGR